MARGRRASRPESAVAAPLHRGGAPATPGAEPVPLRSIEEIAHRFAADPTATLVVSDVHGDVDALRSLLGEVGAIDASGARVPGRGRLIQAGDLVDGRSPHDYDALVFGERIFDSVVVGNHEAALLGGPRFNGLVMIAPEVTEVLWRMARRGQLVVAAHAGDVLVSHAGISADHGLPDDPAEVVAALEDPFYAFCGRTADQDPILFAIDPRRGGAPGRAGGVLWQDWASLLECPAGGYRQIVGHSRVAAPEQLPGGSVICLDPDGDALGVALIAGDGELLVGAR